MVDHGTPPRKVVKVIKRGTQPQAPEISAAQAAEIEKKSTKIAAREMVSNVATG